MCGAQRPPVRIEAHHAVISVHFLARGGEVVQDLLRLLRHARLAGLQQHVDDSRAVTVKESAKELVVAGGPASQKQHVVLAIDDLDVGLAQAVGRIAGRFRRLDTEAQGVAAGRLGRQLELHRHDLAVAAQGDLPAIHQLSRALRGGGAFAGRPRQHLYRDRLSGKPLGANVAGDGVVVARVSPRRHDQIGDDDAGGLLVGAEADREDGDPGVLGQLDSRVGRHARVLAAIAQQDHAGDGRSPLRLDQLPERLADPRFGAGGSQEPGPIGAWLGRSGWIGGRGFGVFLLGGRVELAERYRVIRFQLLGEGKYRHVVRLAQPREEIAFLQGLDDLLLAAGRRGRG